MEQVLESPAPLRTEHQQLHARLAAATREAGAIGESAREVARLLHPHFIREHAQNEETVLYPAAILVGELLAVQLR